MLIIHVGYILITTQNYKKLYKMLLLMLIWVKYSSLQRGLTVLVWM